MRFARRTEAAELDLQEIAFQIAIRDGRPIVADRIIDQLVGECQMLAGMGRASQLVTDSPELGDGVRLFSFKRWVIVFRYADHAHSSDTRSATDTMSLSRWTSTSTFKSWPGSERKGVMAETVARWLATEVKNELVSLHDTPFEAVLVHTEDEDHYCFLSNQSTLFDALQKFESYAARGKALDAILISHGGKPEPDLLGTVTLFDLPRIL